MSMTSCRNSYRIDCHLQLYPNSKLRRCAGPLAPGGRSPRPRSACIGRFPGQASPPPSPGTPPERPSRGATTWSARISFPGESRCKSVRSLQQPVSFSTGCNVQASHMAHVDRCLGRCLAPGLHGGKHAWCFSREVHREVFRERGSQPEVVGGLQLAFASEACYLGLLVHNSWRKQRGARRGANSRVHTESAG